MAKFYPAGGGGGSSVFTVGSNGVVYGPDTTGNARGDNAIDISTARSAATDIAGGNDSIVIGHDAKTVFSRAIAIGFDAEATGGYTYAPYYYYGSIAIGSKSRADGYYAIAIGEEAEADNTGSIALGRKAHSIDGFAIGAKSISRGSGSVVISGTERGDTYGDVGSFLNNFIIGGTAKAYSGLGANSNLLIGIGSQINATAADTTYNVSIGNGAKISNSRISIAIGKNAIVSGLQSRVVIGYGLSADATYQVKIGDSSHLFQMKTDGVFVVEDLKIKRAPVATVMTHTHTLSIDLNGTTYYVMLSDGTTP